ncbi:hypothetical protein EVA_12333, partial [gut metagenome]
MKLKNYLLASFGLLAMTACSNDEEMETAINETAGDAYMSLSIEMPNLGSNTRAIDTNGETNAGTDGEQKITELLLLVYNQGTNKTVRGKLYKGSELRPTSPNLDANKN